MFQTKFVQKNQNTLLCSITFFFVLETRAVYETMRKILVERGSQQVKIRRMRIACWIPKATDVHSQYVVFIPYPLQQWSLERSSILRYM